MQSLGDAIRKKMQDTTLQDQIDASRVVEIAEQAFASFFDQKKMAYIKPLFLKNRTLTVSCASSVVAQEIRLHHEDLVSKINEKLGKKEVDRIRYLS